MFFHQYNRMSGAEVKEKLRHNPKAENKTAAYLFPDAYRLTLALKGQYAPKELSFIFTGEQVEICENGARSTASYAAGQLDKLILCTVLLPDSGHGWHFILDTQSGYTTVFETWFGITVPVMYSVRDGVPTEAREIPREVQRQIYFGSYGDQAAYAKPHRATNHLEGRGLHWKDNHGMEILTFFPSVSYSTFVPLTTANRGETMAAPSDYVRIDDRFYLFARFECEYAGGMFLSVIDFMTLKTIDLHLGFDDADMLRYEITRSTLIITGNAAHFERMDDDGSEQNDVNPLPAPGKGARVVYRPRDLYPQMTKAEAKAIIENKKRLFLTESLMTGPNTMEQSGYLAGKAFKVCLCAETRRPETVGKREKITIEYDVTEKDTLKWRFPNKDWREEQYVAFEAAKDIVLFSHMLSSEPDGRNVTLAIDFVEGLATCISAQIGNWRSNWEVGRTILFGTLTFADIIPPKYKRHHFTNDLVGKSFAWTYADQMASIHVYSSPISSSWTIFNNKNSGGATWSSPIAYIKLRDDLYLISWVEETCNGNQGVLAFNPRLMHDTGFFYGLYHGELQLTLTGATARYAGSYDIRQYFGLRD